VDTTNSTGFNLSRWFEKFTFNFISRFIGTFVRLFIFFSGLLVLILVFIAGPLGLILWLIFPPISFSLYRDYLARLDLVIGRLYATFSADPSSALPVIFKSPPGQFVLSHTGLEISDVVSAKLPANLFAPTPPTTFSQMLLPLVEANIWSSESFRRKGCQINDLLIAAGWWDSLQPQPVSPAISFGQPGIGSELLFGFTPTLDSFVTDLSSPQSFSHHLISGRDEIISRIERTLVSGNSVMLTGLPGVGKRTVVMKFAYRARIGLLDPRLAYRRILELNYNFLLSETLDINTKKSRLSQILIEAADAGNIILFIKDLHRLTDPQVEGVDFTDVLEQFLDKGELKIISIASQSDFDRFISSNQRLRKYFTTIEVTQPSLDEAMQILLASANRWEQTKSLTFTVAALRQIIDGCDRLITETPFPEKALDILDEVVVYAQSRRLHVITPEEINTLLAQKTGISLTRLTAKDKQTLANLESTIHQYLIDQDQAVSLIAKSLRARSLGTKSDNRPIGSFLFLGPTGVGKTQSARALAQVYYGSPSQILRFDMAEYAGFEGLSRLIGSVSQNQPGVLTTSIKNHPTSLLLLDEIEKAPPQVYNLLLSLLDEGIITDAFGKKILCRHLFVIATSNAGSEYIRQLVSQGISGEKLQKTVIDYVQKIGTFSPELLNRFDGVVVYSPLGQTQLIEVARLMLVELKDRLHQQGVELVITDELCQHLATVGYEPQNGARPMRRLVDLDLGDMLAQALLRGDISEGDTIKIIPSLAIADFKVVKA